MQFLLLLVLAPLFLAQSSTVYMMASFRIEGAPLGNCSVFSINTNNGQIVLQKIFPFSCKVIDTDTVYVNKKFYHHSTNDLIILNAETQSLVGKRVVTPFPKSFFSMAMGQGDNLLTSLVSYGSKISLTTTNIVDGTMKNITSVEFRDIVPQRMVVNRQTKLCFYPLRRQFVVQNVENGNIVNVLNVVVTGPIDDAHTLDPSSLLTIRHQTRFILSRFDYKTGKMVDLVQYPENFIQDRYSTFQKTYFAGKFHYALLTERQTSKLFLFVTNIETRTFKMTPVGNLDWERLIPLQIGV